MLFDIKRLTVKITKVIFTIIQAKKTKVNIILKIKIIFFNKSKIKRLNLKEKIGIKIKLVHI